MNFFFNALRGAVSREKQRFIDKDFDLDLTYVTERVIAMAFPAANNSLECAYRNNILDVAQLLDRRHPDAYKVYNLSQRKYNYELFHNKVVDWCSFPDHHPAPLYLLFRIVKDICDYLSSSPRHVAVIHCKAGKGRTGTVISALLRLSGLFPSIDMAVVFFAAQRSSNHWGVTGASQLRYLLYVERLLSSDERPALLRKMETRRLFHLQSLEMHPTPRFSYGGMRTGCMPLISICDENGSRVLFHGPQERHARYFESKASDDDRVSIELSDAHVVLCGDVTLVVETYGVYSNDKMFRCSFNVDMDEVDGALKFGKAELDGAERDKRFAPNFELTLRVEPTALSEQQRVMVPSDESSLSFCDLALPPLQTLTTKSSDSVQLAVDDDDDDVEAAATAAAAAVAAERILTRSEQANFSVLQWRGPEPCDGKLMFFDDGDVERKVSEARMDVSNPLQIVVERGGWLMKRGNVVKSWKRRWFVLKDDTLRYLNSPSAIDPKGTIHLDDVWAVRSVNLRDVAEDKESLPSEHLFEIVTDGRTFLLAAEHEREKEDWLETLSAALHTSSAVLPPATALQAAAQST